MAGPNSTKVGKLKSPGEPPFRLDSILELAWGLTLNFSHEDKEKEVGKSLLDYFEKTVEQYKAGSKERAYLNDVRAALTGYLRTYGLERDAFVDQLDEYKEVKEARIKVYTDIGSLSSVSKESAVVKLASFVGIGSASTAIATFFNAEPTPGLPFNLLAALLGGITGLFLVSSLFRLLAPRLIDRAERLCYRDKTGIWRNMERPLYLKGLSNLYEAVTPIVKLHYDGYRERVLDNKEELYKFLDALLPANDLYQLFYKDARPFWWRRIATFLRTKAAGKRTTSGLRKGV